MQMTDVNLIAAEIYNLCVYERETKKLHSNLYTKKNRYLYLVGCLKQVNVNGKGI